MSDALKAAAALLNPRPLRNEGHGHVFPRKDGAKMRCGGPRMCAVCAADLAQVPDWRDTIAALLAERARDEALMAQMADALAQAHEFSMNHGNRCRCVVGAALAAYDARMKEREG